MNRTFPNPSLEIDVTNLGPIEKAKIELRPLTIFVGPSNTGKSYLAMLIYALHRSISGGSSHPFFRLDGYRSILGDCSKTISAQDVENLNNWMRQKLASNAANQATQENALPEFISSIIRPLLNGSSRTKEIFCREINRCFGIENPRVLIRNYSDSSRVTIRKRLDPILNNIPTQLGYTLQLRFDEKITVKPAITSELPIQTSFQPNELDIMRDELNILNKKFLHDSSQTDLQVIFNGLISRIATGVVSNILDPLHLPAHYFPADRTGIMHANRLVVSSLLERTTLDGSGLLSPSNMLRGVLVDFLEELIRIDPYRGTETLLNLDTHQGDKRPLFRENNCAILEWVEQRILEGKVQANHTQVGCPSFVYRSSKSDQELPLMHASSMVSELAPVVLCLQQTVREGDVLIIEEPESHLHPAIQTAFAKVLARIVKAGVRVIITTHSDWFLEQIGNLMRISDLPERERDEIPGIGNSDGLLDSKDVGAWLFKPSQDITQGSKVEEIELDRESGRFEIDYDTVREELYDQGAAVYNRLQRAEESRDR